MKRITHLIMLLTVLSLLLAACGGGGTAPAQSVAPTSTMPPAQNNQGDSGAPQAEGYQVVPVTGGGTIRGRITYSGPPVEPQVVTVDKDVEKCGQTQEVVKVRVDGSGGLADAVVRITNITAGKAMDALGSEFVLDQANCVYVPAVLIVPVGKEVKIKNSDAILHNVHTTPFDNPPLNVAQPATQPEIMSQAFTIPETIPVGCDVHKWMFANIVVVDTPYAVVSGADGSFTLTDVPAGEYAVEVWHSELGTQTANVTVEAGQEAKLDVDFTQ